MYDEKDVITDEFNQVLKRHGCSPNDFKIKIERGTGYDPNQIVSIQIRVTVSKDAIKKQYSVYHRHDSSHWTQEFENDLSKGYFQ